MNHTHLFALALFGLGAAIAPAQAAPYFVDGNTKACPSLHALMHGAKTCVGLKDGTKIDWDGKISNDFRRTKGSNVGRITADGKTLYVYSNLLSAKLPTDPMKTDFILAHDAIACPTRYAMTEALQARARSDDKWFAETECRDVPAGTTAIRIRPTQAAEEPFWQMRVRFSHSDADTLWMNASDFR